MTRIHNSSRHTAILAALLLAGGTLAACGETVPVDEAREKAAPDAVQLPDFDDVAATAEEETADERFSSAFGTLDLDQCEVLTRQEEGEGATFSCGLIGGVPIFVQSGDGRFDLDAGVQNEQFQTIGAFNEIAPRIEIRSDGGEPFAVIFRYQDVSLQSNNRSVLAVESIGTEETPGCRIAQIGGGAGAANQRAREIADLAADGETDCTADPQVIGDAE